jgi:DNA-binding transcriptional regulator YdaS (Cro superfamily)
MVAVAGTASALARWLPIIPPVIAETISAARSGIRDRIAISFAIGPC